MFSLSFRPCYAVVNILYYICVCCRWKLLLNPAWVVAVALLSATGVIFSFILSFQISQHKTSILMPFTLTFLPSILLGVIAFSQTQLVHSDDHEMYMNVVLVASLAIYITWASLKRSIATPPPPVPIRLHELSALAGLAVSVPISGVPNSFGIICSIIFIGLAIFSFHRRSVSFILILPLFVLLNLKTVLYGTEYMNRLSLLVFVCIVAVESAMDIFASTYSSLSTWSPIFGKLELCSFESH